MMNIISEDELVIKIQHDDHVFYIIKSAFDDNKKQIGFYFSNGIYYKILRKSCYGFSVEKCLYGRTN